VQHSRRSLKVTKPARTLLRKALEQTVFKGYSERIDRFNWNARLVKALHADSELPLFRTKEEMYGYVNDSKLSQGDLPIDLFEFGVFRGESMRKFCKLNRNAASRFFGFDSFQGLPEDWLEGWPKGTFDTGGVTPVIEDSRVQFVAGWFQDSLPKFLPSFSPKNQIVIHSDCDLYSSTLYCLTSLNSMLPSGTVIMFDDFYDPIHEYRALSDYCSAYRREFKMIAATENFHRVAISLL
jgi:O-methyltransferase